MWLMFLSKYYQWADILLMIISLQYYTFYILKCASSKAIDRFPPGKLDIHFPTVVNNDSSNPPHLSVVKVTWNSSLDLHNLIRKNKSCKSRERITNARNGFRIWGNITFPFFLKSPYPFRTFVFGFRDPLSLLW